MQINVDNTMRLKTEGTSRGNQEKWYQNGYWVKADTHGVEGLVETFVSEVAKCIREVNCIEYRPVKIYNTSKDDYKNGCISYNMFNNPDISFISLRNIFRKSNIKMTVFKKDKVEDSIKDVVDIVHSITGLNIFRYLCSTLLFDSIILNEDRHVMNLGLAFNTIENRFYEAQVFDNGISLLGDRLSNNKNRTLQQNIEFARSNPFSNFFMKQVDAVLNLGFSPLHIDTKMVEKLLSVFTCDLYMQEDISRIKNVLRYRLNTLYGKVWVEE